MRLYDIVVLITPDLNEEEAAKIAADYRKILTDGGAQIVKDETWGRRRLAFPILRHLVVRADEELKRSAKSAERIRKKALKRPPRPPQPPAGAAPAPAAPAAESEERSEP